MPANDGGFGHDLEGPRALRGGLAHPSGDGTIRAQAIAWSAGPDGKHETWEDNATSWE